MYSLFSIEEKYDLQMLTHMQGSYVITLQGKSYCPVKLPSPVKRIILGGPRDYPSIILNLGDHHSGGPRDHPFIILNLCD